jgi:phage tail sheath gpL-like
MTTTLVIPGFPTSYKVPGAYGQTLFGQGKSASGLVGLKLLIVALQATTPATGASTVDTEIFPIRTEADAELKGGGAGCELARAAYVALQYPGINIYGLCPTPNGAAAAATATITVAGSWTTNGTVRFRIAGEIIEVGVLSTDTAANVATAIVAAITAKRKLPVTAAVGGVGSEHIVTMTWKSAGLRGKMGTLFKDLLDAPSGITTAIAGGTAITGGGVFFGTGSASEDVTNALVTVKKNRWDIIVIAQNDATNLALWKAHFDVQAGPLIGLMGSGVFAVNAAQATAISLAQTTCNDAYMRALHLLYCETHPTEIAASAGALRTQMEQDNPNADYDGAVLLGVKPQSQVADWPAQATLAAALDAGVTPLQSTEDGKVVISRMITTLCKSGSDPYYGTLDTYQETVPTYTRRRIATRWTLFRAKNPYLRDNPAKGEPTPPQGVATPDRWNAEILSELRQLEVEKQLANVSANLPSTEFDATAERFMSRVPTKVLGHQHQLGYSVEQQVPG